MIPVSAKYSGCGNDFCIVDGRKNLFHLNDPGDIVHLCHRTQTDGLIILEDSTEADCRMRLFNADGSQADMCGNGLRCLAAYVHRIRAAPNPCTIQTNHFIHRAYVDKESVSATMAPPHSMQWHQTLGEHIFHLINTGVPHAVLFTSPVDSFPLEIVGPEIRHHNRFWPQGVNVDIVEIKGSDLLIRTWERGVEGETLACGTGAAAAALAASYVFQLKSPIKVRVKSGQLLKIAFDESFKEIQMTGPAQEIELFAARP